MSTKKWLILGVLLLWLSPLIPFLVFYAPLWLSFVVDYPGTIYFLSGLSSAIGLILIIRPYYFQSKPLESCYLWIDKGLALPLLFICVSEISWLVGAPTFYTGSSLFLLYMRVILYMGVLIFWIWGLFFSKARFALAAVLCFAVFAYMPHPEINNRFTLMLQDQENMASRYLTKADVDAIIYDGKKANDFELSPPDSRRSLIMCANPCSPVVMQSQSYMIFLLIYTLIRFGRKTEEVKNDAPVESYNEPPTPASVQD